MLDIPGYRIREKIYEDNNIWIFRGYMISEKRQPVIIKTLKTDTANLTDASKLLHEYEITRKLNIDGIIKPLQLKRMGRIPVLIMEDVGIVPLKQYLEIPLCHLPTVFTITIQLVEILGELHQNGVVHRNLKTDNILIEPSTGQVKITGFGTAIFLSGENHDSATSDTLIGTSPYMFPEQTGTLNRAVDYRSDYYSLGVILYEMLTGKLHLQVEDPSQWVHAHIAQVPVAPCEIEPSIPQGFSDIIMKLLTKEPGECYRSTDGLLRDIKECRRQWLQTGEITPFPLGRIDYHGSISNISKLYGREKEMETLIDAFDQTCSGRAGLAFIKGYAGVGKTVLVNEIIKPLATKRGFFIYGKFDQIQTKTPYRPIILALRNLIRQLLTESRENLQEWRKNLLRALGGNGAVITEVIPDIELIIGPQPPVESLQPKEAQNRFRWVFRNFINVFAQKKHPLVFFIDDLQWADPASLHLIRFLSDISKSGYLLLIGAYRDNEVTDTHPLTETLKEIQGTGVPIRYIPVEPLDIHTTIKYVADVLQSQKRKVYPLAKILFRKTAGNPFFLKQLLQVVCNEKYITFNLKTCCWEWDIASLEKLEMPDDVLHLLKRKLNILPEKTCKVLKVAACIGSVFDTKILSSICGMTAVQTVSELQLAVIEGLVLPRNDIDRTSQKYDCEEYEFLHDCVRQAVYSLLTNQQKKVFHLNIGHLLLKNINEEKLNEEISSIMDQLNRGLDLVEAKEERIKLARYNLLAGRKAKSSTAYDAALSYLKAGTELLPENSWNKHYQLTYELYLERSQCEYLCGCLDEADRLFDLILGYAKTELEKANVYGLKMVLNSGTGRYFEAVKHGLTALRQLGINLPLRPGKIAFLKEVLLFKWRIRNKKIKDLQYLPEMNEEVPKKAQELMALMGASADSVSPELFAIICVKGGNISIKYGNSDLSSIGYASYAAISCQALREYFIGREFGELAVKLVEKYDNSSTKTLVYFIVGALVNHWTEYGKTGVNYLKRAATYGLESGELTYTGYAVQCIIENMCILGDDLDVIYRECRNWYDFARRMNLDHLMAEIILYQQLILQLQGTAGDPETINNKEFDKNFLDKMLKSGNTILNTTYYCSKIKAAYILGEFENALSIADKVQQDIYSIEGFLLYAEYIFYYSLAITAEYHKLQEHQKKYYRKILKKSQHKMKKWSNTCAENFLHKYLLVEAEKARLNGKNGEAMTLYDQAIESARKNGYTQNEALACELAARYYFDKGWNKIAQVYITDAYYTYYRWGAVKKTELLREQYPELLIGIIEQEKFSADVVENYFSTDGPGKSHFAGDQDMGVVIKAMEDISVEENPQKEALHYLDMVMEIADADKGYLILEKDDDLFIDAARSNSEFYIATGTPVSLENSDDISPAVVRYVARTNEVVVLNGNEDPGIFIGDQYILQRRPKSLLCLPVVLRGIPIGVLYLENTLVTGVFTLDRLEFLKLLSSHMVYARKLQYLLEDATSSKEDKISKSLIEPLTKRELQVLTMIAAGMSNKEIAEELQLSTNTVKMHVMNIYGKLRVNRRVQAVIKARELKIIN